MSTQHPPKIPVTITYLGHSCMLLEVYGGDGKSSRLLIDPGNLTAKLGEVGHIDAILVTHAHPDHFDPDQVRELLLHGDVELYGPADLQGQVGDLDVAFRAVEAGLMEVAGVGVQVIPAAHETLYSGVPLPDNVAYHVADTVYVPGDSLARPDTPVDVLLAPLAGPWMKLAEGIDFVRDVGPRVAVPVHDAGLTAAHRVLHRALLTNFAPDGTQVRVLDPQQALRV